MVDKLILQFWPSYKEFDVVHDYLVTPNNKMQARLRKRGQNGVYKVLLIMSHFVMFSSGLLCALDL